MDLSKRKVELEALIRAHRDLYYNGARSEPRVVEINGESMTLGPVSDEVYDAYQAELVDIDAMSEMVLAIGAPPSPVSEWSKVKHEIPMGSLDKVNELHELTDWVTRTCPGEKLLVSEKLDGISIHLKYVGGKLITAVTRGDGVLGEDITQNVLRMKGVSAKLPQKFTGSIRGEIVLLKSDHQAWLKDEYANTRNAASGIAKRYDGKGCEHLSVFVYRVADGKDFATEEEQFKFLEGLGLTTPNWVLSAMVLGVRTPHDIWVEYQQTRRDKLDYDIDGLVINVNDLAKQIALGETNLRPNGSVAFKFAAITRETVVRKRQYQTGGTGRITPVAIFDPVNLLGAQVTQASLYNYKYILDLKLDIGARVLVARANDVIPRVVSVVKGTGTVMPPPSECESCGAAPVQDGEYYVCPNRDGCPAQVVGRLSAWIKELNVLDFGDILLEKLVSAGKVKNVPDLYRLKVEDIASLERLGEKTATKVLANLVAKNPLPLEQFLGRLSIPGVATSTIRVIVDEGYDTLAAIRMLCLNPTPPPAKRRVRASQGPSATGLAAIRGIGPVKAETLIKWLRSNVALVDDLASVVPIKPPVRGKMSGRTFCFTGSSKRSRAELEALVVGNGGTVKSSVTKNLTYLIMADPNLATTKAQAARKNGTECISEEQFLAMVE